MSPENSRVPRKFELLETFAKIKQNPLILPRKAMEGYQSGKQMVEQIREIPDEEIKAYAIIASDPQTWKILSEFAGDYLDTLTAEEYAELGGAAIPDLMLLVVTGGSGTAASAGSKLSKLKHLKKLLMELVEVLKRKPSVGTNSGPNDTMIKSTNRLRAKKSAVVKAPRYTNLTHMDRQYIGEEAGAVWGTKVRYLDDVERKKYQLHIKEDGKLYDNEGNLYDTAKAETAHSNSSGNAIFVRDEYGTIYSSKIHDPGKFHHSSFLSGKPVASAGEISVENGTIKSITKNKWALYANS